ncbi:MAG: very short patch repair endonuclease [Burkholderiaceae bacterium]|nr:very short patch repair endonuclease [Burkholderiaceae bacterium]
MTETPQQRSRTMRAVRSCDTGPEIVVRRFLHAAGLRFRLHDRQLPGAPDLVFPSRRIALFVHGCFWHQHPNCEAAARPKSHADYWNRKLDGNIARDVRCRNELETLGWKVLVIWECETRSPKYLVALAARIRREKPAMFHARARKNQA